MDGVEPVTRGEFDMLKQQVSDNAHRLDAMDIGGTRGVAVLQLQITELTRDVQAIQTTFASHEQDHKADTRARAELRRTAWRWGVTTFIAMLAIIEGPLLYLVTQQH